MLGFKACFAAIILMLVAGRPEMASGQAADGQAGTAVPPVADGPGPVPYVSPIPDPQPAVPRRQVFAPPDYSLNVFFDHRLPEAQKEALRPIKDLLNKAKLGAPEDRIAYFRTVISPEATLVSGWHGLIHSVKKVKGGTVVELRVTARQSGMVDTANIMERYSIINGKVKYLGFYVPNDMPRVQLGY